MILCDDRQCINKGCSLQQKGCQANLLAKLEEENRKLKVELLEAYRRAFCDCGACLDDD